MERIAIISDIHSNIVALEAVWKDIEERGINRIFCLGDLVLKGSSPCEVVDCIKKKCEVVVKGNAEEGAINPGQSKHKQWYHGILGNKRLVYLKQLPMYYDTLISGSKIRMFHATKTDVNKRIFDIDEIQKKQLLFEDEKGNIPDIVIYGDIHKQYMQKLQNKTIVNVGSVGNAVESPNYNDKIIDMEEMTQAHYCIIEGKENSIEKQSLSIQFVRVPYDIEKEIQLAKENQIPSIEKYVIELTKAKYRKMMN